MRHSEVLKRLIIDRTCGFLLVLFLVFALLSRAAFIRMHPIGSPETLQQKGGDERYYVQIGQTLVHEGEFREGYLRAYRPRSIQSSWPCIFTCSVKTSVWFR